MFKLNKPI